MASIQLPIEAFTSRLNISERINGIRSQSMSSRFANLRPISEFLDIKRISKPANFSEFQSRASYNLSYFSSNYVVVFIVLSIYSLLTNLALLFVILLVLGGSYGIGKLEGRDLNLGVFQATTSQLYTTLLVLTVLLGLWASPLTTALWLICATGAKEVHSEAGGVPGEWSGSDDYEYDDEDDYSDDDYEQDSLMEYGMDGPSTDDTIAYAVELAMRDQEDVLVENALEKIRRAQMHGKANFKLTAREIAALERRRRRDSEAEPTLTHTQSINERSDTTSRRSSRQKSGTSRKRRPSDTTSVAETAYTSPPVYPGYYIMPASPIPSHLSITNPSNQSPASRSQIPTRQQLQMLPPQPQFYPFSQHQWMPAPPNTAGAIPLSVPQSQYPMYPRPGYPPPLSNIMCQPVYRPASRDTYENHPPTDQLALQRPSLPSCTRTSSRGSSSDNGVKITNDSSSGKKDAPARQRRAPTKSTSKTSKAKSSKKPDTPAPDSATSATSTALDTSKSSSSKTSTGRNGFTRPKRKRFRWI
ncbi:prenylated Rab acceptor [Arthroderma uncinatum]|uniref:prenylated Rab acceptor n=1 Tax=Arthroderma uncinatum TaxID=74035 RepID=UPI00144AEBC2|nr:prenylated Rab acceptor [Arthroderma uncinatum]KAF3481696.1 prenylated Rab acceptor [Arthroderma uncinatum]